MEQTERILDEIPFGFRIPKDMAQRRLVQGYAVDPRNPHDRDDAIFVEVLEDGNFLIQIHIADVAACIDPEYMEEITEMARYKGDTQFYANDADHMLGSAADFLSLSESQVKPCLTVSCVVTPEGRELDIKVERTKIRAIECDTSQWRDEADFGLFQRAAARINKTGEQNAHTYGAYDIVQTFNSFSNYLVGELTHQLKGFSGNENILDGSWSPTTQCYLTFFSAPIRKKKDLLIHLIIGKLLEGEDPRSEAIASIQAQMREEMAGINQAKPLKACTPLINGHVDFKQMEGQERRAVLDLVKTDGSEQYSSAAVSRFLECFRELRQRRRLSSDSLARLAYLMLNYCPKHELLPKIVCSLHKNPKKWAGFISKLGLDRPDALELQCLHPTISFFDSLGNFETHMRGAPAHSTAGMHQVYGVNYIYVVEKNHADAMIHLEKFASANGMHLSITDDALTLNIPGQSSPFLVVKAGGMASKKYLAKAACKALYSRFDENTRRLWPEQKVDYPAAVFNLDQSIEVHVF